MSEDKKQEPAEEWLSVDDVKVVSVAAPRVDGFWEPLTECFNVLLTEKANGATSLAEFERRAREELADTQDALDNHRSYAAVIIGEWLRRKNMIRNAIDETMSLEESVDGDVSQELIGLSREVGAFIDATDQLVADVKSLEFCPTGEHYMNLREIRQQLTARDERIAELEQERKTSRERLAYIDKEIKDGMNSAGWLETSLRGIRTRIAEWIKETDA